MNRIRNGFKLAVIILLILGLCGCGNDSVNNNPVPSGTNGSLETNAPVSGYKYDGMTAEEITASLTLEQKAYQMVMPGIYNISVDDMKKHDYGAVLSQSARMDYNDTRKQDRQNTKNKLE